MKNLGKFTSSHLCWSFFRTKSQAWSLQLYEKEIPTQVFSCEFCEIFKNIYSVERFQTATSELINSCETSKWLLYTNYHIFCWMPRKFTPTLSFSPVSLYAFDFKFYIQGYILIKSIVALTQLKLFHECKMLVVVVVFVVAVFAAVAKPEIFLNKLVFNGLIKILFMLVFFEINWSRVWSENIFSIWYIYLIHSTSNKKRWSSFS